MKRLITKKARELGFDTVGFCSADPPVSFGHFSRWIEQRHHGTMSYLQRHARHRSDPRSLLAGARSVIAVTLNYNQQNRRTQGAPQIARYALGRDYHKVMRSKLKRLGAFLDEVSPGCTWRACVDSAPILEREFAQRAGLGWFGKNTMLIDSKRGSWFFIGLVLTSFDIEPDAPSVGGCGSCRKCVEACPTGAIGQENGTWRVDAKTCISYLTIEHKGEIEPRLAKELSGWTFGCDVCQEVCPFNQERANQPERARTTNVPDFLERRAWPTLVQLAQIKREEWDALTRGSPVRRTGHEGLKRNARLGALVSRDNE